METLREELTFKDHRLLEMEGEVKREKETVCSHENEVQSLLDKLAVEVEKNTQLSLELQEGRNGSEVRREGGGEGINSFGWSCQVKGHPFPQELVDMVNSNSSLRNEVDRLELELKSQLVSHKQQMESAEGSLNALLKQKASDELAIGGLVTTIQELRGEKEEGSAKVTSLSRDLEDSGRELTAAVSRNDVLVRREGGGGGGGGREEEGGGEGGRRRGRGKGGRRGEGREEEGEEGC